MPGARLTWSKREEISVGLAAGLSQAAIARSIGVHRSTVSREVRLNTPSNAGEYRALPAMAMAMLRAPRPKPRKLAPGSDLRRKVLDGFKRDVSAQLISGRLRREHRQ